MLRVSLVLLHPVFTADAPSSKTLARFRRAAFRPEETEESVLLRPFQPPFLYFPGESPCAEVLEDKIAAVITE